MRQGTSRSLGGANRPIGYPATALKRRAMLNVVALCSFGVAAVVADVALMLWALMPAATGQALRLLIGVPLLPLAMSVWCLPAWIQSGFHQQDT